MTIDLTRPDEQDWLNGEEALPIRYSESTTEDERTSDAVEQLREPLATVLSDWLHSSGFVGTQSPSDKLEKATTAVTKDLNSLSNSEIEELFDSVEPPDHSQGGWMDEYLHTVAETVVAGMSDSRLQQIALRAGFTRAERKPNDDASTPPVAQFRNEHTKGK